MPKNITTKVTKRMRPEFRRLMKDYNNDCKSVAKFLETTQSNVWAMRSRGHMSEEMAYRAGLWSLGEYDSDLLSKRAGK